MGHREVSDKIALAPGQQSAEYFFVGENLADLGAQLDAFYRQIDYDKAAPSGSISIDMPFHVVRSWQNGVERVSYGRPSASLTVYKKGPGE